MLVKGWGAVGIVLGTLLVGGMCEVYKEGLQGAGPKVKQTQGEPWPMPQTRQMNPTNFLVVRPSLFTFDTRNRSDCFIVEQAVKRYYSIILSGQVQLHKAYGKSETKTWKDKAGYRGYLDTLVIELQGPCEFMPHDEMDESYELHIDSKDFPKEGLLLAKSNWGILRGLETFVQLIHPTNDFSALQVRTQSIVDFPRFSFRSVLLDTSRHFLSKKVLLQNLDLMAMNKLNVFHWHIVDDQSFPYQSIRFPELSDKGAYHRYTHVYTQSDIAEIIEYARVRGIRVVPEFDTPGHTQSWGPGIPNLLTPCYKKPSKHDPSPKPDGTYGPMNPILKSTYSFLKEFFSEIASVFPDKYLHLGGDEVSFDCWGSNPDINSFMKLNNLTDYAQVEGLYMQQLVRIIAALPENKTSIVWQEVLDNKVRLGRNTIIHVWKGGFAKELETVTRIGYRSILYACWYLDKIMWGIDWPEFYKCDPQAFNGTREQKDLVVGGGAALWGEFVDSTNAIQRLWPRASAPAEKLWSSQEMNSTTEAAPRMEEHRCRLLQRGFPVQPSNGPGFCLVSYDQD